MLSGVLTNLFADIADFDQSCMKIIIIIIIIKKATASKLAEAAY
jgi:hypothetical protein